jgi:hypothetical protein
MDDLTIEQVLEIARERFPNFSDEQILRAFYDMQNMAGTNNYETVLLIQKQMEADKAGLDAAQPKRFAGLAGRMG